MDVGVLVSGSGTNLQALIDAQARGELAPARIVLVISNRPDAGALTRAAAAQIPSRVIDHRAFGDRPAFEQALLEALAAARVELVVLAGFMRVLTPRFLRAFPDRVVNVHPALLPSFPGVDAPRQAFEHGVKVSGVTVHLVDEGTDTGPILAQVSVPVHDDDTVETLRARILFEEHRLYPRIVRALARRPVRRDGRRALLSVGD
jgi:phosphoribosylglycinamide formyltransferase-1